MEQLYLMTYSDSAKFVMIDMQSISNQELALMQEDFASSIPYERIDGRYAAIWRIDESNCIDGVYYNYELAGAGGANFLIFQWPGITSYRVEEVKKAIASKHDAVSISVMSLVSVQDFDVFQEWKNKTDRFYQRR